MSVDVIANGAFHIYHRIMLSKVISYKNTK